jgi:hypothetical protein
MMIMMVVAVATRRFSDSMFIDHFCTKSLASVAVL